VTHDLAQAAFLTEEIAVLRDGRVEARGALPDLERQTTSSFVTEFIGAQRRLLEALR
jgi:osmoprotectant transport system ATP-binding protein